MSDAADPSTLSASGDAPPTWSDPARAAEFQRWLARVAPAQRLVSASLRIASADASFRRYLRIDMCRRCWTGTSRKASCC